MGFEVIEKSRDKSYVGGGGAKVTVINEAIGLIRTVTTNASGEYVIALLPVGRYTLTFEAGDFMPRSVNGVKLELDQRSRIDAVMEVGPVNEAVTVDASKSTPLTRTETAEAGEVISMSTVPPIRSVMAGAAPRYGTCRMKVWVESLNISPQRWKVVPTPADFVGHWEYYLPYDSFDLTVSDPSGMAAQDTNGDTLPDGDGTDALSDRNPDNDLVGLQNPDGIPYTGDEVMLFQDSARLARRVGGAGPCESPSGTDPAGRAGAAAAGGRHHLKPRAVFNGGSPSAGKRDHLAGQRDG